MLSSLLLLFPSFPPSPLSVIPLSPLIPPLSSHPYFLSIILPLSFSLLFIVSFLFSFLLVSLLLPLFPSFSLLPSLRIYFSSLISSLFPLSDSPSNYNLSLSPSSFLSTSKLSLSLSSSFLSVHFISLSSPYLFTSNFFLFPRSSSLSFPLYPVPLISSPSYLPISLQEDNPRGTDWRVRVYVRFRQREMEILILEMVELNMAAVGL